MGYFDYFPPTRYSLEGANAKIATNIISRVKFLDSIKETSTMYMDYTIRDGERPESLAYRIYGKADYHWIILLTNEIHDPYFQWPVADEEIVRQCERLYGERKALFLDLPSAVQVVGLEENSLDYERIVFARGFSVKQIDASGAAVAEGIIDSWDPTMMKLVVIPISGVFEAKCPPVGGGACVPVRGYMQADLEFSVGFRGGGVGRIPVVRVVEDNVYAPHHFQTDSGNIMSPLTNTCDISANPFDCTKCDPDNPPNTCSVIESYMFLGKEKGILIDLGGNSGQKVSASMITNLQYETDRNETKRRIRLIRPELISSILREYNKVFVGGGD